MSHLRSIFLFWKTWVLILTPIILLPLPVSIATPEAKCGYAVLVVAIYWMAEVVPLAVTSLLPMVLLPLLGILSTDAVCVNYMKESNMMCLGGLAAAIAVEYCNLHNRIALRVLLLVGTSPRWLMLGFMLTTMFLSMWINNTATTAMMVPIVEAVLTELFSEKEHEEQGVNMKLLNADATDLADGDSVTVNGMDDLEARVISPKANGALISWFMNVKGKIPTDVSNQYDRQKDERIRRRSSESTSSQTDEAPSEPEPPVNLSSLDREKIHLKKGILLAVAYAANLGGTGTLTGTNPNLVLKENLDYLYKGKSGLNYATWMLFSMPAMLVCSVLAWLWLQALFIGCSCRRGEPTDPCSPRSAQKQKAVRKLIEKKYADLGPMSWHEIEVLALFIILVLLWVFRDPGFIPGWASVFPTVAVKDSTAAMAIVFLLFVVPKTPNFVLFRPPGGERQANKPGPAALDWKFVQDKMPWGVLLLMGGGFALADASKASGLSSWLGSQLTYFKFMSPLAIVTVTSLMTAVLTQVASNTATATILLPVLADMAEGIRVHPLYLMLPAVCACSYAFILPIATPPNAVVFESSGMTNMDMAKPGIVMNIVCLVVMLINISTIGMLMFDLGTFPDWAIVSPPVLNGNGTAALIP